MAIFVNQNYDDVFERNLMIALQHYLHKKIYIDYVEDNKIRRYYIPFRYGAKGKSERFLQDFYQREIYNSICPNSKCEGDIWSIPEGIISDTGMTFDPSQFSNRFKKTQRNKIDIETGEIVSIICNVNELKENYSFHIEVICNTDIETRKIREAFKNVFYKVGQFEFNYKGIICYCNVGWDDVTQIENTVEWTFGSGERLHKTEFNISVETDYPVFDPTTEYALYKENIKQTIKIKRTDRLQEIMEFWVCEHNLQDGDIELTSDLKTDFKLLLEHLIKNNLYNEYHTSQQLGFDTRRYFEVVTENEYKDNSIETFVIRINRDSKDFSVQKHIRDTNISYGTRKGKAVYEEEGIKQAEHIITKNTTKRHGIPMNTMVNKVEINGLDTDIGLVTSQNE
ncbi:MAG: hypothetical protein FWC41_06910 [Firmicutes bacterium]|nr:hypothetical protein [Bacillota bacterium]